MMMLGFLLSHFLGVVALDPLLSSLLVGSLEHVCFHSVGNFIVPTDEVHHFSEGF